MPIRIGLREIGTIILSLDRAYLLVSFVNTLAELSTESCTCGGACGNPTCGARRGGSCGCGG